MDDDCTLPEAQPAPDHVDAPGGDYSRERSAEQLGLDIDESYRAEARDDHPKTIRPSTIGHNCARVPMFDYLWVTKPEKPPGNILRLFETGEREELRLLDDLKRVGWHVINRDPNDARRQISVTTIDGHSKGFCDGIGRDLPNGGPWRVIECKSMNANTFAKLVKAQSVEAVKPEHFAQLQLYMAELGIPKGLYAAKCKDNDKEYWEYVDLDRGYVDQLKEKARGIMAKRILPARVGGTPNSFACRNCRHIPVCHEQVSPLRNCRTCEFSQPIEGGLWVCNKHKCPIDKALALASCADYQLAKVLENASN